MHAHTPLPVLSRKNFVRLVTFSLFALILACGLWRGGAQTPARAGREVVEKIPKHLPIKVKVKKPEKLKDAGNEGWFGDLEIEVTNTGNKPIYFFEMALHLPDVLAEDGRHYGFKLRYGRIRLAAFEEPVRPDDIPIQPGGSVTIKAHANEVEGWERFRAKGKVTNPKKLVLKFQEINHGDGTGFVGYAGTPIPVRKERSSSAPCLGSDTSPGDVASAADPPRSRLTDLVSRRARPSIFLTA